MAYRASAGCSLAASIVAAATLAMHAQPSASGDLDGIWNYATMTPLERPRDLARATLTPAEAAEYERSTIERQSNTNNTAGPDWWDPGTRFLTNGRTSLIVDPSDGRVPPQTAEAQQRARTRQQARAGRGPADSWEDRSLYDRCITRGIPGSMMPAIYGNSYHIQQGPGFVTITYEMVHDTRVIPLDGRPHLDSSIRQYVGDGRGRWEGNTLVIETTNFTDKTPYRGSSDQLKLVERFTPLGPDTGEWAVTFEDPRTWAKPWTFAMNLTRDAAQPPFEYACHEGNYGLRNILEAARAEERAAAKPASR